MDPNNIRFFKTQEAFRRWLTRNHDRVTELWIGFHKKDSGKKSITYQESLDEALCFGWIDGIRKKYDETSYVMRFTPRRKKSIWSAVNLKRAAELEKLGLMADPGLKAFHGRDPAKARLYSYEQRRAGLTPELEAELRKHPRAWEFFQSQAPWYRRTAGFYVVSAKKEETRRKRLDILIRDCENGRRIGLLQKP